MSHLPLSLMNRLNQTKSAVFKFWMLYFQRISFSDYLEIPIAAVVPRSVPESLPLPRYSVVIFTFSGSLGSHLFGNRVALNPGLVGVRAIASAIMSVFQRISFQIM